MRGLQFIGSDTIDMHRLGNVLQGPCAEILDGDVEPGADMLTDRAGNAYASRIGDLLQSRRHVDAVAVDIAILDDDIAEADADAKANGSFAIVGRHALLPSHGAGDGVDDALKFHEEAVAHELDDPALMRRDQGFERLFAQARKSSERAGLVLAHEARVAHDVGCQNRG